MPNTPSQSRCHQHLMEIVTIDQPFEAQAGHIRPRPQSITPVAVDPCAVNIKSECRSEKTKKRPIEPVIDNVAAGHWTLKACEIWPDRFVGYGRIIKRKCTGKESVAHNPVRMCGMNASEHRHHDQQAPWQHGSTPRSAQHPIRPAKENHVPGQSDALLCCVVSFRHRPGTLKNRVHPNWCQPANSCSSAAAAESGYECRLADATSGEQRASRATKQLPCSMGPRLSN